MHLIITLTGKIGNGNKSYFSTTFCGLHNFAKKVFALPGDDIAARHGAVRDWVTGPAGGQNITHLRCGDGGDNCAAAAPPAIEATLQNKAAAELLSAGVARLAPCQARGSTVTNADTCTPTPELLQVIVFAIF